MNTEKAILAGGCFWGVLGVSDLVVWLKVGPDK